MLIDDLLPGYADLTLKETGLTYGGQISINSGDSSKFDISAGGGVVANHYTDSANPTVTDVVWTAKTAVTVTNIGSTDRTYISLDLNGSVIQQDSPWTPEQRRDYILLGLLVHPNNSTIQAVGSFPKTTFDITQQLVDFVQSIGPFNVSGNVVSPNGTNLNIDRSAGSQYRLGSNYGTDPKNPSITSSTAVSPLTFRYRYRDGIGGFVEGSDTTLIDGTNYDNAGVITAVPSSQKWQIQRFWVFASGVSRVMYGQNVYKNMADALAALVGETFDADPDLLSNAALRGWIILSKDTTNLSDDSQAKFIEANSFGDSATGGVSSSTTTLQKAYDNSSNPEIITNTTQGALSIRGGTGTNSDSILEVKDNAGSLVAKIQADGDSLFNTISLTGGLGIGVDPTEEVHVYGGTPIILIENTSETDTTIRLRDAQATVGTQDLDLTYNCSSGDFSIKQDTEEVMNIDAEGALTLPKQPAAHRTLGSTQTSVTGDGTVYTLQFPTEIFDQGGNLSSTVYTSPKTAKHYISGTIALRDVKASGADFVRLKIVTTIRTYTVKLDQNADLIMDGITTVPFNLIGFEMDEGDTVSVTVQVSNGSKTVDIYTSSSNYVNLFIGILL